MAEGRFWQRRESKHSRGGRNQKAAATSDILEAIAQLSGGGAAECGGLQMKIVVKKEDLKQVLEAIRDGRGGGVRRASPAAASLEQRLSLMRRRQLSRQAKAGRSRLGPWRPVLQSIPEEL